MGKVKLNKTKHVSWEHDFFQRCLKLWENEVKKNLLKMLASSKKSSMDVLCSTMNLELEEKYIWSSHCAKFILDKYLFYSSANPSFSSYLEEASNVDMSSLEIQLAIISYFKLVCDKSRVLSSYEHNDLIRDYVEWYAKIKNGRSPMIASYGLFTSRVAAVFLLLSLLLLNIAVIYAFAKPLCMLILIVMNMLFICGEKSPIMLISHENRFKYEYFD